MSEENDNDSVISKELIEISKKRREAQNLNDFVESFSISSNFTSSNFFGCRGRSSSSNEWTFDGNLFDLEFFEMDREKLRAFANYKPEIQFECKNIAEMDVMDVIDSWFAGNIVIMAYCNLRKDELLFKVIG